MSASLHIETFTLGDWMTNCYVVRVASGACWIVDAGFDPAPMLRYIDEHGLSPRQVVLTHAHVDHIAGLDAVRKRWPELPILIHEAEREFLTDVALNLSIVLEQPIIAPDATDTLAHGQMLTLDGIAFEVRHTPGHSPGGITLYQREHGVALAGDALFAGSIGRTDFPTSDHAALMRAIREQLLTLPNETRVLPGHGPETTIGRERVGNPFLQ
ncbi:MAG: MBL fold metallo-hydrolase [Phycisphaeraceae bacterium]